jgi:haloalkane dehalogenase
VQHRQYLDALLEALGVDDAVTLVVHDWGRPWASTGPVATEKPWQGIAYMEAIVRPLRWEEWPQGARSILEGLRSPAGEEMVLEKNLFVEAILPASVMRELTPEEMAEYRRPFVEPGESRRPTLTCPARSPSTANLARCTRSSPVTPTGCRPLTYPSCSSSPSPAPFFKAANSNPADAGPTNTR